MKKFNIKTVNENNVEDKRELEKLYQEKALRLQLLQQFLEQVQNNLQQLNNTFVELNNLKENIESLKEKNDEKNDGESIVQLYQGVFLKAKIESFNNFIVGVGKNILVEKNKVELLEFLDKQIFDAKKNFDDLNLQFEDLKNEYVNLYEELKSLEVKLR